MLRTSDFNYNLPEERIALTPPAERSGSKLLVYKGGGISDHRFQDLSDQLPSSSLLIFNDSRVIPARLVLQNDSGARIEVFLLEPQSGAVGEALTQRAPVRWKCLVGNKKRWKDGQTIHGGNDSVGLSATWHDRENDIVALDWSLDEPLAGILGQLGKIPLPPYLNRETTPNDSIRYQTVYAHFDGAVAAPTAGLHFTKEILEDLKQQGIKTGFLTLHVGAGTFLPVKSEDATEHRMHEEELVIRRSNLKLLLEHHGDVIPVGTTSMRSLETIYWLGARLWMGAGIPDELDQHYPYSDPLNPPGAIAALQALDNWMDRNRIETWTCKTSIFIRPGYKFRICKGLITNFHQPRSTLLMLISALIGDNWRSVYQHALDNEYRFLSYGDSSLLLPGAEI